MASLTVAYIIWMFGGIFGLHHLYLGRMYHAFVWYSTLGGLLGMGWMRDLWRLPDYVQSSNADKNYQQRQLHRIALNPKPSCGIPRFSGLFVMGYLITSVMVGLIPNDYDEDPMSYSLYKKCLVVALAVVGSSVGVYIVANVGELQCSWKYPVVGALLSVPWLYTDPANLTAGPLISTLVTWWWGLRWKPMEPLNKNRKAKCAKFVVLIVVWTSLLSYALYHNATISIDGGEKIPLKVALANFFASPAWHQTKQSLYRLFRAFMDRGWNHAYNDASDIFDFSGENNALDIIGMTKKSSQEEIVRKCRKLSAQTHPDRFKTDSEKETAQAKFIEIQDACSTLSKYRSKGGRGRRNDDS